MVLPKKDIPMKLIEENVEEMLQDIGLGKHFLEVIPKAQATKAKIDKGNYIKLKKLFTAKETSTEQRDSL